MIGAQATLQWVGFDVTVFRGETDMPLSIACPQCKKTYRVGDETAGKQVRCQQCSTVFIAQQIGQQPAAPAPDPLAELAALPAVADPLGPRLASPAQGRAVRPASPAPEGPSDAMMRLVSAGLFLLGLVMLAATFVMDRTQGAIYLGPLALAPLALILGVAGMISPDVVRAAGKYGGHLPWQYKAVAWGLMGLCAVITLLLIAGVMMSGYRPG